MDPFMPLHTGQTPEEAISHRPMEWSICCAYQQLYELSQSDEIQVQFTVGTEPNWLSKAVHQGLGWRIAITTRC